MKLIAAIALLLAGCTSMPAKPLPAMCSPLCFQSCVGADGDTGVRWKAYPVDPAAWDELGGVLVPELSDKLRQCDVRRDACVQCLQRLDKAKAIKL